MIFGALNSHEWCSFAWYHRFCARLKLKNRLSAFIVVRVVGVPTTRTTSPRRVVICRKYVTHVSRDVADVSPRVTSRGVAHVSHVSHHGLTASRAPPGPPLAPLCRSLRAPGAGPRSVPLLRSPRGLQGIALDEAPQTFGEGNFRFRMPASLSARRGIAGIAWRLGATPDVGQKVDMAIRFSWNYWRDSRNPQVTLVDWKPSE